MNDKNTMLFVVPNDKQSEMSQVMSEVYKALKEKGYNPLSQLVGYVMSGDPTYITNYKNARSLITRLERDEMIEELKADKEKTKAGITGVEIAARIIKECKPYCQGVHIMALGWESKIPDLLKLAEI